MSSKQTAQKINRYITALFQAEDDVPTLAGLAVYLDIPKQTLDNWEKGDDEILKKAVIKAKNQIEHYFISRSALKKINNSTAHFYLNNVFCYSKDEEKDDSGDLCVNITIDEPEL